MILLFLIPISLIKDLIHDRRSYQSEAVDSIILPLGGRSEILGIVVALPYKVHSTFVDSKGVSRTETSTDYILFAPDVYDLSVSVLPRFLSRGIFKVPVFQGEIAMNAKFSSFDCSHYKIDERDLMMDEAVLMLGVSNPKTLCAQPSISADGGKLSVSSIKYDSISPFSTTVYFSLPLARMEDGLNLTGTVKFQGGESIKIQPVAADNEIRMESSWATPSFSGGWLPSERSVKSDGFSAVWNIAGLSTAFPKSWRAEEKIRGESVEVSLITPVDTYKKTTRSIKYALLFMLVPFISIFICEIFSKVQIHPVQYCLVGLADVMFYLLLLSISEHLPFNTSYALSALCVCTTTFLYSAAIFHRFKWGALLSAVQMISYVFLYGTLQAEDYALLIGSIGLFMVVALLMFITRKIDWYDIRSGGVDALLEEK